MLRACREQLNAASGPDCTKGVSARMAREIDVEHVIDKEPLGTLRILLAILISTTIIVDGFDIQVIAFVTPVLIEEWGVSRTELALAVSAALVGMAVGAPVGGGIGDRFGRRRAMILSTLFFGLATLPAALATNHYELAIIRFFGGLGFGAVLPNATALIAEWMPRKLRSYVISIMIIGVPVGGMIGAGISNGLIEQFGWQSTFVVGGILGIVLSGMLFLLLPESPKFLVVNSDGGRGVVPLLNKAFGRNRYSPDDVYTVPESRRATWSDILNREHRKNSLGIALAFAANLMVFYGMVNWLPTIMTSRGFALEDALSAAMWYNLAALMGALIFAPVYPRIGQQRGLYIPLIGSVFSLSLLVFIFSVEGQAQLPIVLGLIVAGTTLAGLQVGLYSLAAAIYPTDCRSTGIGFAAGAGRLGPIFSAAAGGAALDLANGTFYFFGFCVSAMLLAILGVYAIDYREGRY